MSLFYSQGYLRINQTGTTGCESIKVRSCTPEIVKVICKFFHRFFVPEVAIRVAGSQIYNLLKNTFNKKKML